MIEFSKAKDRITTKSVSFEIDHKLDELEIETEEFTRYETERHTYRVSKEEAKQIFAYLKEWVKI